MKNTNNIKFTPSMKKTHTILLPSMLPFHFELLKYAFNSCGYTVEILKTNNKEICQTGLKYVNNDMCYPSILIVGQFIEALNSGNYNLHKIALLIPQTGGACRASNYFYILRKALDKCGYTYIPIISLNVMGIEKNSGFKITYKLIKRCIIAICYGDLIMWIYNQVFPYEINKDETLSIVNKWFNILGKEIQNNKFISNKTVIQNYKNIINDFNKIPINNIEKIKVGIVGELYVKYCPLANHNIEKFLFNESCEYKIGLFSGYAIYVIDSQIEEMKLKNNNKILILGVEKLRNYIINIQNNIIKAIKENSNFNYPSNFFIIKQRVKNIISHENITGDGWYITGEILELFDEGYSNIICISPFGCLANHVIEKGIINKIKHKEPKINITYIDYDSGDTELNQVNRIKLLLENAKKFN